MATKRAATEIEIPPLCTICREHVSEDSTTPCGHVFHTGCIKKWFGVTRRDPYYPICTQACSKSGLDHNNAFITFIGVFKNGREVTVAEAKNSIPNLMSKKDGDVEQLEGSETDDDVVWVMDIPRASESGNEVSGVADEGNGDDDTFSGAYRILRGLRKNLNYNTCGYKW